MGSLVAIEWVGRGSWLARVAALLALLCGGALAAHAAEPALDWTDEPPVLSRWIEQGYRAERSGAWQMAAEQYCSAARFGSLEAQYRLGRLFGQSRDGTVRAQGQAALALAAQRGHVLAAASVPSAPPSADLPACLLGGSAAVLPPEALDLAVPPEVVEHYVRTLPPDKQRHAKLIQRLAPRFDVDARLALAIARAESNFDPSAVSAKNAQGLMQLIPDTALRFGVRDTMNPEQNVRGGLAYLRWLLARFEGRVELVSAAYNAGEGVVERYGGVPPYAETQQYVQRILHFYRARQHVKPVAM